MVASARRQFLLDAAVAVAFLGIGWLSTAATTSAEPAFVYRARDGVFVLLLCLATLPYAARRFSPTAAFLVGLGATTTLWSLGYNGSALPLILLVGAYWVAAARPVVEVVVTGAAALGGFAFLLWADGAPYGTVELVASVVSFAGALALGRAARLRGDLAEARARATEEAARRRSGEERLRVSGELHDIVGHSLGIIAVQAGVGRHLIASDPERAAESLDNIAQLSRDSLDEVRTVVAALRDDAPAYQPAPGLADLAGLVETTRSTGLAVTLTLPDDIGEVSRQAGAAAYRITREALTNVVRHAKATAVSVDIEHRDGWLSVAIRDDGVGAGAVVVRTTGPAGAAPVAAVAAVAGHGITGMRERAEAVGGSLSAGPAPEGGFLVSGRLPAGRP